MLTARKAWSSEPARAEVPHPGIANARTGSTAGTPVQERISHGATGPAEPLCDLIAAAKAGDADAFDRLLASQRPRALAAALRVLRNADDAEDAVQDALVIAWRDLPALRDPDRFDAWLGRILVRTCIAEASRHRRRLVVDIQALPFDIPVASDDFLSVGDRDQLERGFRRLPPEQRALLVLRHYAGFEPAEIAELLGVPAGTARSRLHHAHRAMRAALEADARSTALGGLSA